jgi:hypothetical protein
MSSDGEMARRFGARVSVVPPARSDRQLFLVIGTSQSVLKSRIAGLRGRVFLGSANWCLAQMRYGQAMALRGMSGITMVGGVTIDPARWKQLGLPSSESAST